jgi:hypothetical protein
MRASMRERGTNWRCKAKNRPIFASQLGLTYSVQKGDWEGWLDFFLDGVATVAEEAAQS